MKGRGWITKNPGVPGSELKTSVLFITALIRGPRLTDLKRVLISGEKRPSEALLIVNIRLLKPPVHEPPPVALDHNDTSAPTRTTLGSPPSLNKGCRLKLWFQVL